MKERPTLERMFEIARTEAETAPLSWWWLSYADGSLPAGSQFLGVAIVKACGFPMATITASAIGANPGGECQGFEVPADIGDPPEAMLNRLIRDRAELDELSRQWTGSGTKTIAELES